VISVSSSYCRLIKSTDIDGEVDGEVPHCIADFLNDPICPYKRSVMYGPASEERVVAYQ
jgi:hypothetical protein